MTAFSEFIEDAKMETSWTHDVPYLDTQDEWYVFVYGNKRGKSSAYFTHNDSDASFVGIGWTKSPVYSILNIVDGKNSYTVADVLGTDRILGEIWKVPTDMMILLDGDERNQLITRRFNVPVIVNGHQEISAWIYTTNRKYLVSGGITVSKHTSCTYIGANRFLEA